MREKPRGGYGAYLVAYSAFLLAATRKLAALGRRQPLDLVEAHNMPDLLTAAAIVPRLKGTPVVLNVHDTFPELFATKFGRSPRDPLVRLVELEERVSARLADRVIVVTQEAADRLASRGVGVGRTVVVMNTPDESAFGPARAPVTMPADGPIRILYHGGLAPRFGVEVLIRSVGHLNGSRERVNVRVIGSGEDRDRLAALAAEIAPERIDVAVEPVPFAEIPGELAAAHVGVVPTIHDHFTELLLPVKLMEYVHAGLPVVASRLPAIENYFDDDSVRLFDAGSARCARPPPSRTSCTTPPRPGRAQRAPRTSSHRSAGPSSAVAISRWSTSSRPRSLARCRLLAGVRGRLRPAHAPACELSGIGLGFRVRSGTVRGISCVVRRAVALTRIS